MNEAHFAADYARLHASYEKQAYLIFKKALDRQCKAVSAYVEENGLLLANLVLPALINREITREAYIEAYTAIGVRHARNYSRLLDRLLQPQKSGFMPLETKAVGFSSEFWRNIMVQFFQTEAATRVTQVDETTIERIRVIMAEAQEQNLSTSDQARYLTRQLNDARFNATRAMMIARTESTVGSNTAAQKVAEQADFVLNKGWSAAGDSRTRNSHRVVGNADPIPMDALFEVPTKKGGMEFARYPGDVTLSAENVIQCRCAVYHLAALDADGLPIPVRQPVRIAPMAAAEAWPGY